MGKTGRGECVRFSDFLRLLDGLLRVEHASLPSEMLDEVERFLDDLNEHTFRIAERVVAIRALRICS